MRMSRQCVELLEIRISTMQDALNPRHDPPIAHSSDLSPTTRPGGLLDKDAQSAAELCDTIRNAAGAAWCFCDLGDTCAPAAPFEDTAERATWLQEVTRFVANDAAAHLEDPTGAEVHILSRVESFNGDKFQIIGLAFATPPDRALTALSLVFPCDHRRDDRHTAVRGLVPLIRLATAQMRGRVLAEADLRTSKTQCAQLRQQVQTDALTGLKNTRAFTDGARARLIPPHHTYALILIDIDHFKRINDVFGHAFGDKYLQAIATALSASTPKDANLGRVGGDEFALLVKLPGAGSRAYLTDLLTRCRNSVQRGAATLGKPELGRISIGISRFPAHGETYADLFQCADAALYAAKASGRGTVMIYDAEEHARFNKCELETRFFVAKKHNRIQPYFQPIVDLASGCCVGFEALARWIDADGRVRLPGEFDALFRDHRTAEPLTRLMIASGLEHFARWRQQAGTAGETARLSLNLTAFDLMNPEFVFELQSELGRVGLDWSAITLEITENIVLGESKGQIYHSMLELRARGARLAMDDFGTGHGGFQHLRDLPVDVLKVDHQFIRSSMGTKTDRAVVEAILSIAERCDMKVVAEGIETCAQLAELKRLGCAYGQGFYFNEALPSLDPEIAPTSFDIKTPDIAILREVNCSS